MSATNRNDVLQPEEVSIGVRPSGAIGRDVSRTSRKRAAERLERQLVISRIAVLSIVCVGFVLRCLAAVRLSPHVDEAASILAAEAVAHQFLPILPSGTVYFQGYTLSLLLAPLFWLGYGGLDDLLLMRMVPVLAGTAATYLMYRLGSALTGQRWVGVVAALLLALDPLSVQWSGHVRMYSLLQLLAIALAWVFIRILADGATWQRACAAILLSWAAVFTHVGAAVLIASIGIGALILRGWRIWRYPRLMAVLAASGLAPIALLAMNRLLSPAGPAPADEASDSGISFVGNSQIRPFGRFLDASASEQWAAVFSSGVQFWLGPTLLVAASSLIAGYLYLHRWRGSTTPLLRTAIIYLSTTYWVTAVAFIVFTTAFAGRYLLHVHTTGYILVALLVVGVTKRGFHARDGRTYLANVAAVSLIAAILLVTLTSRLYWRFQHPVVNPNYHEAMEYVGERHSPGQPVIVALPPVGYLGLDEDGREHLYFLAGPGDGERARNYSSFTEDGRRIDYWVGADTIVSADVLRQLLIDSPGSLLVIDPYRLNVDWAYQGEIEGVIREMTTPLYEGEGGVLVMGVIDPADDTGDSSAPE